MLQQLYTYVAKVYYQCFISIFRAHVASVCYLDVAYVSHIRCICFIWMLRMFAMVFKYFLVFFKCFKSMFQVFYLPSNVCCNYCIQMFQKRIGCCISPPRLLLHRLDVSSSQHQQSIHTMTRLGPSKSEALPPSPLVGRAAWAPGGAREMECSAWASGRWIITLEHILSYFFTTFCFLKLK